MARKAELINMAKSELEFRGHVVAVFVHPPREKHIAHYRCAVCEAEAVINTKPRPPETEIAGEALHTYCVGAQLWMFRRDDAHCAS